ncbi:hypothetical protein [Hyphomicrobium sp.]|uniref:hypothetical protein n=1 Tax=Hyphomicrobium sp. TaxID=82 RepID=UPI001D37609A|nr:hypothetical protein [Hyphomicrobium sp.]MBY0562459.1 hypothetical protein [Hyphomicrobium sp.]
MDQSNTLLFLDRVNDHVVRIVERQEDGLRHFDMTVMWPNGVIAWEDRLTFTRETASIALPTCVKMITDIASVQSAVPTKVIKQFQSVYPLEPVPAHALVNAA